MQLLFLLFVLCVTSYSNATENTTLTKVEKIKGGPALVKKLLESKDGSMVVHTPLVQYITAGSKGGDCDSMKKEFRLLKADLQETKMDLQKTKTKLQESNSGSGSTFTRWGRKNCTANSQLVYSGAVGGSYYTHTGAAANPLCLSMSPQWDGTAKPRYYALLYGTEYEYVPGHHDHDVPCSVCRTPKSTTIMVPATLTCPTGWTTQYTGHLAAGRPVHKAATEFLCLDGNVEDMQGGHENKSGYLLYYTVTQCGSLHCPPYIHDRVVTCVVCSK